MHSQPHSHRHEGSFLFNLGYFLRSLLWLAITLVLLSIGGRQLWLSQNREPTPGLSARRNQQRANTPIDWSKVDADLADAIQQARKTAMADASDNLQAWTDELSTRIDERFIPWYFDYWTQKEIGFKSMGYWLRNRQVVERFLGEAPSAAERITEDIQTEFARHVLRPAIAQRELERMARNMLEVYFAELQDHLSDIQSRYDIPRPEWEAYLQDLALIAEDGKPDTTSLTLKTVYTSAGTASLAGTAMIADSVRHKIHAIGSRYAARQSATGAGKAAAATATKTGAKTSAKLGGKLLGPIVLIGVVTWDVVDHRSSRKDAEPVLRENLNDYLIQLHDMLLNDPETGMAAILHSLETDIAKQQKP